MKASEYSKLYTKQRQILIEGFYGIQHNNPMLFIEDERVSRLDSMFTEIPQDFVILLHRNDPTEGYWLRLYAHKDYDLDQLLENSDIDEDDEGHPQDCTCEYCASDPCKGCQKLGTNYCFNNCYENDYSCFEPLK